MTPLDIKLAEAAVSRGDGLLREFDCTHPGTPLHWLLNRAKADAAEALISLVDADPTDIPNVRKLQNEAQRYRDLARYMAETIAEAEDAHHTLSEEDRSDLLGLMENAARAADYNEEG